jgi:hypothetical protein
MMVCRALPLVAVLVAFPLHEAGAQFGGLPGMPGSAPSAGFGPSQGPPPVCQQLLALRDETQKHAGAIQAANQRKATAAEACRLFKVFLASDAKMIKGVEDNATVCGVPPEVPKQMKAGHSNAEQIAKQVCDAAAMGPRPAGPSLSDALGASPTVPDANKRGRSTFDTLTGNALAR